MNDLTTKDSKSKIKAIIAVGSDISGAAAGGATGFLLGGPAGAAFGAATGAAAAHTLRSVGEQAADRLLSPREKTRVGAALAIAADKVSGRLDRGETLRSDGFFEPKYYGLSDAEEIAESVLIKCQHEAEERKVPYMALLIANIAFDPQISPALAHQIIKTAENLTYRQLCILKLAALKNNFTLRVKDYRGQQNFEKPLYEILYECLDLYHRALINFGGEVAFGPTDIKPNSMSVQGIGADLLNQMGLLTIPDTDLTPIAEQLSH